MEQEVAEAGKIKVIDTPVLHCKETEVLVGSKFSLIGTGTEPRTLKTNFRREYGRGKVH